MALKAIVDSLDSIDAALHAEYEHGDDGKYHLKVDGGEDVTGLKKALDAERKAAKEAAARLKAFGDLDPSKVQELLDKAKKAEEDARKAEEARLLAEGKMDELLLSRTETMRREHENKLTALQKLADEATTKHQTALSELAEMKITSRAISAINEVGMPRKDAMVDILARCRMVWKMDETNNPIAYNTDGTQKLGKDGRSPISFNEWAEDLLAVAPHLFEPSTGGGAGGGNRRPSASNGAYTQEQLEKLSPKEYAKLVREGKI